MLVSEKAPGNKRDTSGGIVTSVRPVWEKAQLIMPVRPCGKIISVMFVQPRKALSLITVTFEGMLILLRFVQPQKAPKPIWFRFSGRTISVREKQD
jgi:hypothetical protein